MTLTETLKAMVDDKVSDVFVEAGLPLTTRRDGQLVHYGEQRLGPDDTQRIIFDIYQLANRQVDSLLADSTRDDDFSFAIAGIGRFRVNVFRQRGTFGAVIRIIPFQLPDPAACSIPDEVMECAALNKGLVLITGPAGSGKTTTLACLVDQMNKTRSGHIITLEDPIEYVHRHQGCIVTQREIPTDVATYAHALRSAMREAPDVILIGEVRDAETIAAAMTASEMAQLVFSTLHTTGAASTVDRIIDAFPANQQRQIRLQLAMVLRAVVSQQLVPAKDGSLVPAFEIMTGTPAIRNLIREEKTHQMDSVIAASADNGMITMDQSLYNLYKAGTITKETALQYAIHEDVLARRLEA